MLEKKSTILFSIGGIVTLLGIISGVAPGILLQSYILLGLGAGLVLFIIILFTIAAAFYQYEDANEINRQTDSIFRRGFTKKERMLLVFTGCLIFTSGVFLGILCQLLLKAIQTSLLTEILIGAVCLIISSVCLIILLIIGFISNDTDTDKILQPPIKNDRKSDWTLPVKSISSNRFNVNEKVLVNEQDVARILDADGVGNYRIQYLKTNEIDQQNGSNLRRIPMIS